MKPVSEKKSNRILKKVWSARKKIGNWWREKETKREQRQRERDEEKTSTTISNSICSVCTLLANSLIMPWPMFETLYTTRFHMVQTSSSVYSVKVCEERAREAEKERERNFILWSISINRGAFNENDAKSRTVVVGIGSQGTFIRQATTPMSCSSPSFSWKVIRKCRLNK